MECGGEGAFMIIESLARAGRSRGSRGHVRAEIKRSNRLVNVRLKKISLKTQVGASLELYIEGSTGHLIGGRGDRTDQWLGNDGAKGLIESGQLSRFETKALIEADAA